MVRTLLWLGVAAGALASVAGCQKNADSSAAAARSAADSAALVGAGERSGHFAAVNRHLELGGALYAFVDVDGDAARLGDALRGLVDGVAADQPQAAFLRQDFRQILDDLGLTGVKAVGLSSVADPAGGYRNRCYFHLPEGRRGLLAGLGGPPAPFPNLQLAPADADLFCETELDLPAVYAALRAVTARVGGDTTAAALEAKLKALGNEAGFSAFDLVNRWKGRSTFIARFEPEGAIALPTPEAVQIPAVSFVLRFDGVAPALKDLLDRLPAFARTEEGGVAFYALKPRQPVANWTPLLAIEGEALYFATSRGFLDACRGTGPRLAQDPGFAAALGRLGKEGNGLTYLSPRFFTRLHELPELNRAASPELARTLALAVRNLPSPRQPLLALRTNLPDGILFRSALHSSLKEDLAMLAIYNPVTIGALVAVAAPAFQKVRTTSQDNAIRNNLRQLALAAERHYRETGASNATYADLVGPGRYLPDLRPVAGESYRSIIFRAGAPVRLHLPDGRTFEAKP